MDVTTSSSKEKTKSDDPSAKVSQSKNALSFSSGKGKATIGGSSGTKLGKRKVVGGDGEEGASTEKSETKKKKKEKKGLLSFGDGDD